MAWQDPGYVAPSECVLYDARTISNGTIATLTGYRTCVQVQAIRSQFVVFVVKHSAKKWRNWQHAWTEFAQGIDYSND